MPRIGKSGKQIKVWLPDHLIERLVEDAQRYGEKYAQPVIRHILGDHYAVGGRQCAVEMSESEEMGVAAVVLGHLRDGLSRDLAGLNVQGGQAELEYTRDRLKYWLANTNAVIETEEGDR